MDKMTKKEKSFIASDAAAAEKWKKEKAKREEEGGIPLELIEAEGLEDAKDKLKTKVDKMKEDGEKIGELTIAGHMWIDKNGDGEALIGPFDPNSKNSQDNFLTKDNMDDFLGVTKGQYADDGKVTFEGCNWGTPKNGNKPNDAMKAASAATGMPIKGTQGNLTYRYKHPNSRMPYDGGVMNPQTGTYYPKGAKTYGGTTAPGPGGTWSVNAELGKTITYKGGSSVYSQKNQK